MKEEMSKMKKYKLMRTDYITECVYQTNDLIEMKNKVLEIITKNYQTLDYASSGIIKIDISTQRELDFYEGAWIEVYEDDKLIQSVDMLKAWELK